jgi:hypothetical protein
MSLGINSLYDVLEHASRVEFLRLDGFAHSNLLPVKALSLPQLRTIQLLRAPVSLCSRIGRWILPSLRHLTIIQVTHLYDFEPIVHAHNNVIKTVELGQNLCFRLMDHLTPLFQLTCAKDIGYFVNFTSAPRFNGSNEAIECIHWNSLQCMAFTLAIAHIDTHIQFLLVKSKLPNLRKLVLHGLEWKLLFLENDTLQHGLVALRDERGLEIVYPDDRVVLLNKNNMT